MSMKTVDKVLAVCAGISALSVGLSFVYALTFIVFSGRPPDVPPTLPLGLAGLFCCMMAFGVYHALNGDL